jgi:nucleoside 2-deoxyribosyltransferase
MKIFISHAIKDAELIENIKVYLEPHNIDLLIAEHYIDTQNTITHKIENMIKVCDVALFLLTENGFNSHFVHQEIGYIQSLKKPMLQLV